MEEAIDKTLRGKPGKRAVTRDALGRVIAVNQEQSVAVVHGPNITLTLDVIIQKTLENSLQKVMTDWKPAGACGVVMNPQTGEILALASFPSYDPNKPNISDPKAWKNLVLSAQYEPGSTFKPFVVAWALQKKMIKKDDVFNCEYGKYRMGSRILRDHHPYGNLSVTDILVKSSNIGMAKIGERLTNEGLSHAVSAFGFGGTTGLDLPGEINGHVRPLKEWTRYSTGSIPMGQEISTTPIQMISAMAVLANGGAYIQPHLIKGEQNKKREVVKSQIIDRKIADWIIQKPLRQVVIRGTGKKANLKNYAVFGKTGTAQKYDVKTKSYSHTRHVCSFIGGAPANNPQVLVLICVDEPTTGTNHGGGTVAAPAAAKVLEKTLLHMGIPASPAK